MKSKFNKYFHAIVAVTLLPLLTGCGGGGGGGSLASIGSLFAGVNGGSGTLPGGEEAIATITNPEPASMLLLGGGMAAMAYFRNNKK